MRVARSASPLTHVTRTITACTAIFRCPAVTGGSGIIIVFVEHYGWIEQLSPGVISRVTLVVLCIITVFLLLEVERFQAIDEINARLTDLDVKAISKKMKDDHYAGVIQIHQQFPADTYIRLVESAAKVTILNTWIPNLDNLKESLIHAINRDAVVRILLLHPNSGLAQLRDEALRTVRDSHLEYNVRQGVERCLSILGLL